jgi:hypothetical protein
MGRPHLHSQCNFAESLVETAPKSLRHSCRSELRVIPLFPAAQTMPSPRSLEGPRIAATLDLPLPAVIAASLLSRSVVTGPYFRRSRGLPTALPVAIDGSVGFTVMSGIDVCDRSRTGQLCLPDKEFRYLRHPVTPASCIHDETVARSFLSGSSCRHEVRTISSLRDYRSASRVVSEGSTAWRAATSLLIVRTRRIFTTIIRGTAGYSEFPAYSGVL